jgi:anti-sigma factor RsiW
MKLLSDDLDGSLGPTRKARLEAHLAVCPACRAYRDGLARLREALGAPIERPAEYWAGFEKRLEARIDRGEGAGSAAGVAPFAGRRRLAWASASVSALAVLAAIWFAFLRPRPVALADWPELGDPLAPLYFAAEADPELAQAFDREVRASIDELVAAPDADAAAFRAADPLFWEGLSEAELDAIAEALESENGLGGPR